MNPQVPAAAVPAWLAGRNPKRTAVRAGILISVAYLTFNHVLMPVRGVGISMYPTVQQNDILFVNKWSYRLRDPRRGDIVAVRIADRSVVYVKRLIGLPGEQIEFNQGIFYVNGSALDEPYVVNRMPWQYGPVQLDADEYFVVGDNRGMPIESHEMGTAPLERLIGPRVFWTRLW